MNFTENNKYLYNVYSKLAIKFDQYLNHICTVVNIDEKKSIFSNNSLTIFGSSKYGIKFIKPRNIIDLANGCVGELLPDKVTGYYGFASSCEISQLVFPIIFKCEFMYNDLTYSENLPNLYYDIEYNSISIDDLLHIKKIISSYSNFYKNLAIETYHNLKKNYNDFCIPILENKCEHKCEHKCENKCKCKDKCQCIFECKCKNQCKCDWPF
jgi:hypothetical protein